MYRHFMPVLIALALSLTGCAKQYVNQNPTGQVFPRVSGESLEKTVHQLPDYFNGRPVVLLLGYKQQSQFDIDRWLIGLDMTQTNVEVYELPTIQGWIPSLIKSTINDGMRKGIPADIWRVVITIYEDGETVQVFTGNESPNNARVMLLDESGAVQFFHDGGFAVAALNELRSALNTL